MEEINYLTQLIDNFLISTWVGISTGIIVYLKIQKASWLKILESISLGFLIFIILLFVLHQDLLDFVEWLLTLLIFLVLWTGSKILNLK